MTFTRAQLPVLILTGIATASPSRGDTLKVGPNQTYKAPSAAAAVAKNGDHIEIEPGQYFDCAVWNADNLVIEGTDSGVVITDKTCNGMGLFVIWGNNITVRNLTLTRSRVPDMNGAGIRLVKGSLTVDTVKFIDNQTGLFGGSLGTTVAIRNSDFDNNGICAGACAHAIYIENVDLLRVENSHFSNTRQGHSIKSRALRTEVIGCTITDGSDGTSSYLIEAPTLFRRPSCEKVAPSGQFEIRRSSSSVASMTDGLSTLYQDLLSGSYDCVDRIVLNAYFRMGHSPGGFRVWWRALTGSDETLENAYLMRLAGRFSRRVRHHAKAHNIAVIDFSAGQRKHELAEEYLAKTRVPQGLFLVLVGRAQAPVWDVSAKHHIERKKPMPPAFAGAGSM